MSMSTYTHIDHTAKLTLDTLNKISSVLPSRTGHDTIFFPMGCYRTILPFARSNKYPEFSSPFDFLKVMTFTSFRGSCDVDVNKAGYNFTFVDTANNTANKYYVLFDESFITPSIADSRTAKVGLSFRECGLVIVKNWKEKEA